MPGNEAFLTPGVKIFEEEVGGQAFQPAGTSAAAFVGTCDKGPIGRATLVTSWYDYQRKFGHDLSFHMTRAAKNFFYMGGQRLWVVRTCHYTDITDPLTATAVAASVTVTDGGEPATDLVTFEALTPGTWGNDLMVEIANVDEAGGTFDLIVYEKHGDRYYTMERFEGVTLDESDTEHFVEDVLSHPTRGSIYIKATVLANGNPAEGSYHLTGGDNGTTGITDQDYIGDQGAQTGLYALDNVDEILAICHPGNTSATVIIGGLNYVLNNFNRRPPQSDIYVYDLPLGLEPQEALEFVRDQVTMTTGYEAVYYPWVKVGNREEPVAPYMLGIYAKNDMTRGVWQAPAGAKFPLPVTGTAYEVKETDQQVLNPRGINCIRHIPWEGILPWGARTLDVHGKFRYLNVRRFVNAIKKTLFEGSQQFVFELNGPKLWERIEDTARRLLFFYYSLGAFAGKSPEESFYAKCDEDTNPPELVEQGIVTCEIGIVPPKPAEFVVFNVLIYPEGALPVGEVTEVLTG